MADPPSITVLIADEISGRQVRGSDGGSVGRVRNVYLQDRDGTLAALTVSPSRFSSREVLIPLAAIQYFAEDDPVSDPARVASDGPGEPGASDGAAVPGIDPEGPVVSDATAGTGSTDSPRSRAHRISTALVGADAVLLSVTAEAARSGAEAPATGHVTPELLRQAARALGIEGAPPA